MQSLFCEAGQHHWQRQPRRGPKPRNCPDHSGGKVVVNVEDAAPKAEVSPKKVEALEKAREVKQQRKSKTEEAVCALVEEILADERLGYEDRLKFEYIQGEMPRRQPADRKSLISTRTMLIRAYFRKTGRQIPKDMGIETYT